MYNLSSVKDVNHKHSGVYLITPDQKIVGQHRDDKPNIYNPNTVGPFGGAVEAGETSLAAAYRELVQEETNLDIMSLQLHIFGKGRVARNDEGMGSSKLLFCAY